MRQYGGGCEDDAEQSGPGREVQPEQRRALRLAERLLIYEGIADSHIGITLAKPDHDLRHSHEAERLRGQEVRKNGKLSELDEDRSCAGESVPLDPRDSAGEKAQGCPVRPGQELLRRRRSWRCLIARPEFRMSSKAGFRIAFLSLPDRIPNPETYDVVLSDQLGGWDK